MGWIEGYCEAKPEHLYDECHVPGGHMCKDGIVMQQSDLNHNAGWQEEFPEPDLSKEMALPPSLAALLSPPPLPSRASGYPHGDRASAAESARMSSTRREPTTSRRMRPSVGHLFL